MDNIMADIENAEEEEDGELNIARRTRSHLRIGDFVPNDNLDFPDVDMNLYQNPDSEVDTEYKKFLNQCYSEELGTDNTNNDDNDPEYVYNDDIFSHGWRFDLNEVRELDQEEISRQTVAEPGGEFQQKLDEQEDQQFCLTSLSAAAAEFKSPSKPHHRRKIDMFDDPEFARILNQQLRQHIQLLTQTYLLTKNTTTMRNEAEEAKSHLNSYLRVFRNKSKPSNLLPALDLVNNLPTPKDVKSSVRLSWRPLPIPETIKKTMNENPNIFIYPSLLPQVAFSFLPDKLIPKKPKINFTINEDKLLAYALNEFKSESSQYAFIASLLMTAKTKTQISNHIKNIKRSPGNEDNPIRLYYSTGQLPHIDLDSDAHLLMDLTKEEEEPTNCEETDTCPRPEPEQVHISGMDDTMQSCRPAFEQIGDGKSAAIDDFKPNGSQDLNCFYQDHDVLMNMNLDDLMAASTTISKSSILNVNNNSENNKNIKNLKLKKSMLNLMSHNFLLSKDMGDLIIYEFLKVAQDKLAERNNLQLLQLLTNLSSINGTGSRTGSDVVTIYREISKFLEQINAPSELNERIVLLLDLDQATKCGCSMSYLHWMRFFEFMQHVELYHDGLEAFEKKLLRLIDALQKDDPHKVKLAISNLVNKHPFLKREFESLSLDEKPHQSLFICEEDFDDITDAISMSRTIDNEPSQEMYDFEHFNSKVSEEELSYASQTCPCNCHSELTTEGQPSQHCGSCNLKFMKGRMYLVNKIKPILAEWSYTGRVEILASPHDATPMSTPISIPTAIPPPPTLPPPTIMPPNPTSATSSLAPQWTFEEDREILEFCRSKAVHNDETISFDTSTFEELINRRRCSENGSSGVSRNGCKKSAKEIAERFNQLMELYNKDENSNTVQ